MSILDYQIENKALSHAYIFEGENKAYNLDFAKHFAGRIFESNSINISNESNPDLIILDKADDVIDIDSVRKVIKDISLAPSNNMIKIYIIHNAHNMRTEGSNAMLKTIEELKDYNIVIFTTTNSELLLPTIRSRCQLVRVDQSDYAIDVDMEKLSAVLAGVYKGDIASFYKNKSFFDSYRDDRNIIVDAMLYLFEQVILTKYRNNHLVDSQIAYNIEKMTTMGVDDIDEITNLIYKVKLGFKNNINYDLAIEEIIFNIYRKGMKL